MIEMNGYGGMVEYQEFLQRKSQAGSQSGFEPVFLPSSLFDFQRALVEWAVRRGRAAIFADCGLGKTLMQLVWADNVVRHTNGRVLIITPLAVSAQTVAEGEKFGIESHQSRQGTVYSGITVTNYERLHYFQPSDFQGVVLDESSAIKNQSGERRAAVTEFLRTIPYRLLCTATPSPNDFHELGTQSEALGELGAVDMLGRFFVNDQRNCNSGRTFGVQNHWRFKGHAEQPFWRWVCSWARAIRKPSDMGFSDEGFVLPPLHEQEHVVQARTRAEGMLFDLPAMTMQEEREERRRTLHERCERAAEIAMWVKGPSVLWCHLNTEGDLLSRLIPGSRQVSGADADEAKEDAYHAFTSGGLDKLILKPAIGAHGLNWQHCAHIVMFGSHSYEQRYQSIRRCWRYGQTKPVIADTIVSEGELRLADNVQRKHLASEQMFTSLVANMHSALTIHRTENTLIRMEAPKWL